MELFDKRFVHFMWDDELEGKKCFVANGIDILINAVNKEILNTAIISRSKGGGNAIHSNETGNDYYFAYYDPNYEWRKAYIEGKKLQTLNGNVWEDITTDAVLEAVFAGGHSLRFKPEEEKWIVYLARQGDDYCYLTACTEDNWADIQKNRNVKTKLFVGSESEVGEWYQSRRKFAEVIKAWEDGKELQFRPRDPHLSWQECQNPSWDVKLEYRVKPECPCEDDIDSKACVGCEHSEDGKKKYRPYESSAEMIIDFKDRFKVNCPSYCEPLIWVKGKETGTKFLVFSFYETFIKFNDDSPLMFKELFDDYTYLDGSPCGMEAKE